MDSERKDAPINTLKIKSKKEKSRLNVPKLAKRNNQERRQTFGEI
jgi:hypothetical protein